MSEPAWTINPYAVGLLLQVPDDDTAQTMVAVYQDAQLATRAMGLHPSTEVGKAIHAAYVGFVALHARQQGMADLAEWLDHAAGLMLGDLGPDLAAIVAEATPPRPSAEDLEAYRRPRSV